MVPLRVYMNRWLPGIVPGFVVMLAATTVNAQATPELLARASDAMEICAANMPNSRATSTAMKENGYRYEGVVGRSKDLHLYSLEARRIIAATTTTQARQHACIVVVSEMTVSEARKLAEVWIRQINGEPDARPANGAIASWTGKFKRAPVILKIIEKIDFGIMRGAAIGVVEKQVAQQGRLSQSVVRSEGPDMKLRMKTINGSGLAVIAAKHPGAAALKIAEVVGI